jgi:hypothetical protein
VNKTWASRIIAVIVLSVYITVWNVAREHRWATLCSGPSIEQAKLVERLQHAHFGRTFPVILLVGLIYVSLAEGIAYVLRLLADDVIS